VALLDGVYLDPALAGNVVGALVLPTMNKVERAGRVPGQRRGERGELVLFLLERLRREMAGAPSALPGTREGTKAGSRFPSGHKGRRQERRKVLRPAGEARVEAEVGHIDASQRACDVLLSCRVTHNHLHVRRQRVATNLTDKGTDLMPRPRRRLHDITPQAPAAPSTSNFIGVPPFRVTPQPPSPAPVALPSR
jgi:hypothetical protein